jgi:glutamyl-tRNA reductase
MRQSTSRLRKTLADAEAADDAQAAKLQGLMSFLDKAERGRIERDNALKAAIDEDQAQFMAELKVMEMELAALIAELRGQPVHIEGESADRTLKALPGGKRDSQ